MTERLQGTDHSACAHVGARPLRWSAVVVSRGLGASAMDSTCHTRSTHAVPVAACAILGASLLAVGAVLMKPVESSGISARIDGANGSIDPHQDSNMKTSQAFRTAGALGVLAVTQIALVSGASAQSTAVQWRVEDGGNGHWYQGVVADGCTWTSARTAALAMGGDLVSLGTQAESDWVYAQIASQPTLWNNRIGPRIGLVQDPTGAEPVGGWGWSDGTPLKYTNWNIDGFYGQPNPVDGDQCIDSDFGGYYGWPNIPMDSWGSYQDSHVSACHWEAFRSYIVEWSADCNADNVVDYGQCIDGSLLDTNGNNTPDCCEQGIPCSICSACDINPTGIIDGADLGALLAFWGPASPALPRADINRDGFVNGADLSLLLANWGPCGL